MLVSVRTTSGDQLHLFDNALKLVVKQDQSICLCNYGDVSITFQPGELRSVRIAPAPNLKYDVCTRNGTFFRGNYHNPNKGNLEFMFKHHIDEGRKSTDVLYEGRGASDVFAISAHCYH